MEKISKVWKSYMLHPTIQKSISRIVIGLVAALVLDRFVNQNEYLSLVGFQFFLIGLIWLGLAWLNYLKLDGLRNPFANSTMKKEEKKKKRMLRRRREMIDYVDEELSEEAELSGREALYCTFFANLAAGLVFVVPSLIFAFI